MKAKQQEQWLEMAAAFLEQMATMDDKVVRKKERQTKAEESVCEANKEVGWNS